MFVLNKSSCIVIAELRRSNLRENETYLACRQDSSFCVKISHIFAHFSLHIFFQNLTRSKNLCRLPTAVYFYRMTFSKFTSKFVL